MELHFPVITKQHFLASLIAGSLDITAACIQFYFNTGRNPLTVLLYVASGVFGKQAFDGGAAMLSAGLVFHFMIATSFSFLFFTIVSLWPSSLKMVASVYGLFMWAFVRFCIIPFSAITPPPLVFGKVVIAILILMVCIVLPLSLFASKDVKALAS